MTSEVRRGTCLLKMSPFLSCPCRRSPSWSDSRCRCWCTTHAPRSAPVFSCKPAPSLSWKFLFIGLLFQPWSHIADFHKWQQRRDRLFRWGPSSSNSLLWKTKWMIEAASLCVFSPMKNDLNSSAFHIVVKGKAVQPCGHFNSSKSYYKEFFFKTNTKQETTLINSTPRRKPM